MSVAAIDGGERTIGDLGDEICDEEGRRDVGEVVAD